MFILHLGVISRERLSGLELVKEYLKHKQEEEVCIIIERMSGLDLLKEYLKHKQEEDFDDILNYYSLWRSRY